MMDPRLNSVHLPAPRREQFRAARKELLGSQGMDTLGGDKKSLEREGPNTAIFGDAGRFPPGVNFVLVDNDCVYPLKIGINTVGRMPDNDVVVADPYVSRRHVAVLIHLHSGCELHDIASKNGTYVNGKPVSGRAPLRPGDEIQLSDHILIFHSKLPSPQESGVDHTMAD